MSNIDLIITNRCGLKFLQKAYLIWMKLIKNNSNLIFVSDTYIRGVAIK